MFASAEPVPEVALASHLPPESDLAVLLAQLQSDYAGRGVNLVESGKSWAFRTAPDLAGRLRIEKEAIRKLSRAAIETLAIIAYHQPVSRAEIETIRGVATARGTLDVLIEAGWIKPGRRRETPGRPGTWITSEAFLDHFGLTGLADLPGIDDLKAAGLLDKRPAIQTLIDRDDGEGGDDPEASEDDQTGSLF